MLVVVAGVGCCILAHASEVSVGVNVALRSKVLSLHALKHKLSEVIIRWPHRLDLHSLGSHSVVDACRSVVCQDLHNLDHVQYVGVVRTRIP